MLPGSLAWQAPITVGSSAALQAECHKLEGRAVPEVKKKEKSTAVMHGEHDFVCREFVGWSVTSTKPRPLWAPRRQASVLV